ncbi:uncharacterized protein LOC119326544 [Triticum dicoccoides]|uniref:uncharacterized protein LOC119326544 n=1 Tax=Triticum dicoccoides TaxID=85692 RepID=UPI00188EBDC7|nr:uncharacterized protein LOC119326544 [Triticum dicoccoides]
MADGVLIADGNLRLEEAVDESGFLEPFFYDEAEVVAEAAAAAERRQREAEEKAAEHARKMEEFRRRKAAHQAVIDRIREYDSKTGKVCYTRFFNTDFSVFDIDEESPLAPMRYTHKTPSKYTNSLGRQVYDVSDSVNILSVKIVSSDVGFPLKVYGTVIARDYLDFKCVYLFRRSREDYQLINSEDQSLILTGPTRGLVLLDSIYFEVDLKIKDDQGKKDQELSKGLCVIDGILMGGEEHGHVGREDLDSRLSTVEVKFAVVKLAVEATLEIKVLKGDFYGEITACTSRIQDRLVLHDSKAGGVICDGTGMLQLWRRVVTVGMKDMLLLTVATQASDVATASATRTINFTPHVNGAEEDEITCGAVKMLIKVNWSLFQL